MLKTTVMSAPVAPAQKQAPSPKNMFGLNPITSAAVDQEAAVGRANEARGQVIAERLYEVCQKQAGSMLAILRDIHGLSVEGHKAFQDSIDVIRRAARVTLKGAKETKDTEAVKPFYRPGSKEAAVMATVPASAFVRMSEASKFSVACAKGFSPPFESGYHVCIGAARNYIANKASVLKGKTERGAKTALEKAQAYLLKAGLRHNTAIALATWIEGGMQAIAK